MQLFSKKPSKDKNAEEAPKIKAGLRETIDKDLNKVNRYRTFLIVLAVAGLLGITALRMASYLDPPANETRVSENLSSIKRVKIDPKVVDRIKQLTDSNASATSKFQGDRTDPFSEQ